MVSFNILALAMIVAKSNVFAIEPLMGYEFATSVIDHMQVDGDQAAMEVQLKEKTAESFLKAAAIYAEGGYSKNYAEITVDPLAVAISKGDAMSGIGTDGNPTTGKAYADAAIGEDKVKFQYSLGTTQAEYVKCRVGSLVVEEDKILTGCLAATGTVSVNGASMTYTYDVATDNNNGRTLKGFSTAAKKKMNDCEKCPYKAYQKFQEYYGDYDYANVYTTAALEAKATDFMTGNGNADFSTIGFTGRVEAVKKSTAYMHVWMYTVREFEDAIDDCEIKCAECNDDAGVGAWDEGVAFFAGSRAEVNSSGSKLVHALGNKRCKNFKTCGPDGDSTEAVEASANLRLLEQFDAGRVALQAGNCEAARVAQRKITVLMTIPLVQGTLRYAYIVGEQDGGGAMEKSVAEGAVFAASVLPLVHSCSAEDAAIVYNAVKQNDLVANHSAVKEALERQYECLGITCADVGGYIDTGTSDYFPGAEPCGLASEDSSAPVKSMAMLIVTVVAMIFA